MRTRNLPYPAEKVWVDKHKYDEAERLHYEREATLAASAPERCLEVEVEVEAVNGVCHEDSAESDLKGDLKRARNGKKQKKRKRSPKAKGSISKVDFVLTGLLADRVWFEKPFFDHAENAYRKKLADDFSRAASGMELAVEPSTLAPWAEAVQEVATARRNLATLHCAHGSLTACHHIIQNIWINKFDFDDAEKAFVERSQSFVPPHFLDLQSNSGTSNMGQKTPDEGYVTALPTPATPGLPADVAPSAASFVGCLPSPGHQSVNGKPLMSSLQALMSEVWLEKPLYDDAEKCFYENMFDGHPPGKVRPQEQGRPEALKRSRKDKKSHSIGKRAGVKRMEIAANSSLPRDAKQPSPTRFLLHEDNESLWLNKPAYDSAEARYYASEASRMASKEEEVWVHDCTLPKPSQPAPSALSMPATEIK